MTAEQIAALRTAFSEPLEPESWHDGKVLRLLDEREALLNTMKEIHKEHVEQRGPPPCECNTLEQTAAAIAKAEAP